MAAGMSDRNQCEPSPAKDQMWLARMPRDHPPPCHTRTPVGPAPHFPAPSRSSVPVGSKKMGPKPHVKPFTVWLGEKYRPSVVSRRPDCEPAPEKRSSCFNITGK